MRDFIPMSLQAITALAKAALVKYVANAPKSVELFPDCRGRRNMVQNDNEQSE